MRALNFEFIDHIFGARNNLDYYILKEEIGEGFNIHAVRHSSGQEYNAGIMSVNTVDFDYFSRFFKIPRKTKILVSGYVVFDKKEGLANAFFNYLINELNKQDCIHIEAFSDEGKQFLLPKYLKEGYEKLEIISKLAPELKRYDDYIFKDYTSTKDLPMPQ